MAESETQVTHKDFRQEITECWHRLPDKALFFGLLAAWLGLFQFLGSSTFGYIDSASLFRWMWNAYNAPFSEEFHGNLVPLVVIGLFWWKRRELMETSKQIWWPALGLVIGALLLHMVGYVVQQARLSILALFCGIYGLTGLVWGKQWLQKSFFPFILFIFCVPIGSLAESITFPLRVLVTKISVFISQFALGIDVIPKGTQIFEPKGRFEYDVAVACSGIRSLISLIALTTIYGFITFKASWKRALMVLIAFPLAVAGNVVRLLALSSLEKLSDRRLAKFTMSRLPRVGDHLRDDSESWLREDRPRYSDRKGRMNRRNRSWQV
jgi:exosortase